MQYVFEKVKEKFPSKTYRSERTLKKLHLGKHAKTLISINFPVSVFDCIDTDESLFYSIMDVLYEHDSGCFVHSTQTGFALVVDISTERFSEDDVKKFIENVLYDLTNIDSKFAEIESITVQYGDAHYGEW